MTPLSISSSQAVSNTKAILSAQEAQEKRSSTGCGTVDGKTPTPARPRLANPQQTQPCSHTVLGAAERAKLQLRDPGDRRFDATAALAAINGSGASPSGISQTPRLAIDDHRPSQALSMHKRMDRNDPDRDAFLFADFADRLDGITELERDPS
jgi:hypothetical protein